MYALFQPCLSAEKRKPNNDAVPSQGLLLMSGGALLYITPVMFAAYLAMVIAWHRAVDDLAVHQDKAVGAAAEQNSSNLANLKMTSAIHFPELDEIDDDRNGPSTLAVSALAG